jgi:hypothetical protein
MIVIALGINRFARKNARWKHILLHRITMPLNFVAAANCTGHANTKKSPAGKPPGILLDLYC